MSKNVMVLFASKMLVNMKRERERDGKARSFWDPSVLVFTPGTTQVWLFYEGWGWGLGGLGPEVDGNPTSSGSAALCTSYHRTVR